MTKTIKQLAILGNNKIDPLKILLSKIQFNWGDH